MRRTALFPCFSKAQTGGEAEDAERARARESNLEKNEMKSLFKEAARTLAEHITGGKKPNTAPERSSQASVGMLIRTKDPFARELQWLTQQHQPSSEHLPRPRSEQYYPPLITPPGSSGAAAIAERWPWTISSALAQCSSARPSGFPSSS
jgi:hypothetical protein